MNGIKYIYTLLVLTFVTVTASPQVVDLSVCPVPMFAAKPLDTPVPDYIFDAIDEYQSQFNVPPINRTNVNVGYWYFGECSTGTWFSQVSYDGEFFFYPAPKFDGCEPLVNLPEGCHSGFLYDGSRPFTQQWIFAEHAQAVEIEAYLAQETAKFYELVKKHRAKREKKRNR